MNLRALFVFASLIPMVWGQEPAEVRIPESEAPPEVNQALRERVNGFYESHTGSVKRQGMDYVAEDTKDYYFSSNKTVYTKFAIKKIEYTSKGFDRADVTIDVSYMMTIETNRFETSQPSITTWKVEDGKWFWTRDSADQSLSPMSVFTAAAAAASVKPQDGKAPDLKGLTIEQMVAQGQRTIMEQSKADRDTVEFVVGKAGEQEVTVFNGFTGDIGLQSEGAPPNGVTVIVGKSTLRAHENGVVRFKYTPPKEAKAETKTVQLVLQPFNQAFPIRVVIKAQ